MGALGMIAGGIEKFLATHEDLQLPERGSLLLIFGGLVAAVGLYNSVENLFKADP